MRQIAISGLALLFSSQVLAQENLVLTGVEVSGRAGYAYLGSILPLGDSVLGNGWVQRVWLDHNRYQYQSGNQNIHIQRSGVAYALGYQSGTSHLSYAAYFGAGYAYSDMDHEDPGFKERGGRVRPHLSGELGVELPLGWRGDLIASYTFIKSDYWFRGRFAHSLGKIQIGPEVITQGDPNYSMSKLGMLVSGIPLGKQGSVMLKAGAVFEDRGTTPYIGVEYVQAF